MFLKDIGVGDTLPQVDLSTGRAANLSAEINEAYQSGFITHLGRRHDGVILHRPPQSCSETLKFFGHAGTKDHRHARLHAHYHE